MASKTESTAVNELIDLVQSGQKPVTDPDDLMFSPPRPAATVKKTPTRMTATVPPIKGAGDVAPLPRQRAPQSTQTMTSMPPAVRISTAPPSRAVSIPPLAAPTAGETLRAAAPPVGADTIRSSGSLVNATMRSVAPPPMPARRPTLPPPLRKTTVGVATAEGTPAPERLPSLPSLLNAPPPNAPVAAPFEAPLTLDPMESNPLMAIPQAPAPAVLPIDMTSNAAWFEASRPVDPVEDENWVGTSVVPKPVHLKPLLGKLILPMTLLVIAGVFIGGYFAFNGEGGKPHPSTAAATDGKATPAPPTAPAALAAAEAKLAGEEPKPAAAKTEPEPAKTEPAAVEPAKTEPAPAAQPTGPSNTDLAKLAAVEPAKTEPAAAAPVKAEPAVAKTEPAVAPPAPVTPPNLVTSEPGHAAPAIARQPTLVDVRIDSNPSGATVMLVDRGKTSFLGTTPVSAAIDPSRQYDLVFTFENKPTQIEHLDPKTTKRLAVTLGKHGSAVTEAPKHHEETPAPAPAPKHVEAPAPKHVETPAPAPKHETPKAEKQKTKLADPGSETEPKTEAKKPTTASGDGTLAISSKPPCEIYVDGKATGLMTPQRTISLPAGTHKITLVNNEKSIKKTVAVQITANKTEKVIQDLMK